MAKHMVLTYLHFRIVKFQLAQPEIVFPWLDDQPQAERKFDEAVDCAKEAQNLFAEPLG